MHPGSSPGTRNGAAATARGTRKPRTVCACATPSPGVFPVRNTLYRHPSPGHLLMVLKVCSLDIQLWAIEFILSAHEKKTDQLFCLLYLYNPKLKPVGMNIPVDPPRFSRRRRLRTRLLLRKTDNLPAVSYNFQVWSCSCTYESSTVQLDCAGRRDTNYTMTFYTSRRPCDVRVGVCTSIQAGYACIAAAAAHVSECSRKRLPPGTHRISSTSIFQ